MTAASANRTSRVRTPRSRQPVEPFSVMLVAGGAAGLLAGVFGSTALSARLGLGRWSPMFDVANNFLPLWAALIALGLCVALVTRRASRLYLGLSAALLTAALAPIWLELHRAPPRVEYGPVLHPGRGLTIIQFNALATNRNLDAALALVLDHDADIIMVQEPARFRSLEPLIALRYPFRTPCPNDRCHALIYSQRAPIEADYTVLRAQDNTTPAGGEEIELGRLGVATMQLMGPDDVPFTAVTAHFRWPYPARPVQHQRDLLAGYLGQMDRSRAIVGGDFNLTPWTFAMRRLDEELQPMRRMTRALFSFPVPFVISDLPVPLPILPIDHVYAGSRWQLIRAQRGPASGSDHYPIIVEIVLDDVAEE